MRIQKLLPLVRRHTPAALEHGLVEWLGTPVGQQLLQAEVEVLRAVVPRLFGYYCVHAGPVCLPDVLKDCTIKHHFRLVTGQSAQQPQMDPSNTERQCATQPFFPVSHQARADVREPAFCAGRMNALPFESNSVDAILLHHCLDVEADPHSALREACRVLMPGGSIVLVGFNPWSLWGLWRLMTCRAGFGRVQSPWGCRFVSPYRLSDWLNLLDFEVEGCETRFYLPAFGANPIKSESPLSRVQSAAERYLHHFGATYLLVAKKREVGMMPLKTAWQRSTPAFKPVTVAHAREPSVGTVASLMEARRKRDEDQP